MATGSVTSRGQITIPKGVRDDLGLEPGSRVSFVKKEVTVTARRWERGWELWLDDDHVTQFSTLADAEQQVRDYLDTEVPDVDHSEWVITVVPELGALGREVVAARKATEEAAAASLDAARRSREVARQLREAGYSVTDAAAIMGVSRGRVSQLVHG
ncbi:MAG: AbrB/MazE/SpoVT family DNA-binding domain-containing protein [Propioniciclava sp.]|uniref:AbrB/MazE/SpoVT family DNA-binding domain-containing protein n=1 Tax=Propioniciclava sp. TaxID=2038686 RepID=UPI0039E2A696